MGKVSRLTLAKKVKRQLFSLVLRELFLKHRKGEAILLSIAHVSRMKESLQELTENNFYLTREKLFTDLVFRKDKFVFLEFGVSEGRLTKYFFKKHYERIISWHGFDTFVGLPQPWGDLSAGTFSTNGKTPEIKSKKIHWYIGLVEDFREEITRIAHTNHFPKIFIFDLDLYEPSKSTWLAIKAHLRAGDILYFDEAFYYDERNLVAEILSEIGSSTQNIGFTLFGVAYEII